MILKPIILYFDNGQTEKRKQIQDSARSMGFDLVPLGPQHFLQTIGYLAKVKGFPPKKISVIEAFPSITEEVMVFCNFKDPMLDTLLTAMRNGTFPTVGLKAVLTSSNCFWTFSQLFEELLEEHSRFTEQEN